MADAPDKPENSKQDWRSTVFLPRTDFPMKAGLPQKEPGIAERWESENLYQQIRQARAGREKFIFHDGPPYANGDIHIGHALNHTLKDMVVRTQTLLGKDAPYVPGWDCHGLPIEWKVEEQYRKKKLNKDEVPVREFRAECRAYAQHWVDTQRAQLKRLGISADWDKPYLTMAKGAEATIVSELFKFAETGQLYRGAKPVMWSPVEKTALAEAEIEYEDIVSTQIDVAFEIVESPIPGLVGAHAVIWTTTPWTIPVNQAIAYGPDVEYLLVGEHRGPKYLVAEPMVASAALYGRFLSQDAREIYWKGKGSDLAGTIARHPMHKLGGFFAKPRPFLPGDFVTTDQGTGLVHMAPDHGEDDFELCRANGIDPVFAVDAGGMYRADWAWLGGQGSVINAKFNAPDGPICSDLREAGALLAASADFQHSYPHSWRSKAKVIYRCTPQWFVSMDKPLPHLSGETRAEQRWDDEGGANPAPPPPAAVPLPEASSGRSELPINPPPARLGEGDHAEHGGGANPTLRKLAMNAIANTRFVPEKGRNRLASMVEGRPDWVLSRQRAWGVPIAVFVDRKTGELLVDREVNARIVEAFKKEGVDAWSAENAATFLGNRNPDDFEMITDILDVWFDSGCTHVFTLESGHWPEERWPADLYLEGSDQHRGWFQSSLLESCGTRGRAPYNAVLTHGFTMDSKGMKMSKSLGNTINPLDLMRDYGADILRLWALSVDFTEDHRIGKEILAGVADQYRKLRNTFRYLLGALDGFTDAERLDDVAQYPELERYMLHLTAALDQKLRNAVDDFDFNTYVRALTDFCNEDLSAFYFDIRKDSLYCDAPSSLKRRAYRTVLDTLFQALVRWLAPVLVFTTEEVWATRYPDSGSVHLLEWPIVPPVDADEGKWNELRALRAQVTEAIEPLRREKVLGSSLEAEVTVLSGADRDFLQELFITSTVHEGDWKVAKSDNNKCGRCWRLLPEVTSDGDLCNRCDGVVNG
ncbi:isoleucine--tRNA ligase [Sphingomonas flavescens]|uniref:isoleucine--tRNA ligase n=1 Tax=Sphingomonas flavescens TaxID=3132797 RepID=UPI00280374DD|nr:isoleucine--tRNA ligase [Sphingomonas limnosediminicola]